MYIILHATEWRVASVFSVVHVEEQDDPGENNISFLQGFYSNKLLSCAVWVISTNARRRGGGGGGGGAAAGNRYHTGTRAISCLGTRQFRSVVSLPSVLSYVLLSRCPERFSVVLSRTRLTTRKK